MTETQSPPYFGPWFCPYCGFLNTHMNCEECFSPRPFEMPLHNSASSIFAIWYGPIGFYGLPQYLAVLLLVMNLSGFLTSLLVDAEFTQVMQNYAHKRLHKE